MNFLNWEIMSKKMDIEELVKEISVYTYVVTCNLWLMGSANRGLINIGKAW
jgi:hypothetical protein